MNATFERLSALLIGQRIRAVRYFLLAAVLEEDWAQAGGQVDSLDIGLDLDALEGHTFAITWDLQAPGLDIRQHSLADDLSQPSTWIARDVSARAQWAAHLNKPITQAVVHWDTEMPTPSLSLAVW